MSITINHDLRSVDGGTIYMPKWYQGSQGWGNLALPDVYAAASTGAWPEGTIYREGNRTFVFTKMGSSNDSAYRSAGYLLRTKAAYKAITDGMQSAAANSTSVTVNYGEACAVDKYSGGTFGVFGTSYGSRFIVAQAVANASYDMVLTVDVGFPVAMATTDEITLLENVYKEVNAYVTDEYSRYIGVIMHHQVTASEYSWLQTGGVNGLVFYWGSATGAAGSGITMYAYHGAVQAHEVDTSDSIGGLVSGAVQEIGVQAGYATADMTGGMQIDLSILN